ncbi:hypothetical protein Lesp02_73300 [Lentzea sp. NBRC 105346]|uniref:hypothetical protein n=1 Tax=Lentzea sp. NBRC 105346 TaxID=3032205 RepID=UPI0024A0F036|nr:hypothetical protein [Lentzea sp. NBRC 105346]GLZ35143.1 hypothetical protein Lesp02_73300 [Lentzea sp. NBRC 105346]
MITDTVAPEVVLPGPRKSLRALRIVAAVCGVSAVAQPMLAGLYLSGVIDALFPHGRNGDAISVFTLIQLITAIIFVWRGHGRRWPLWASLAIFLAVMVQMPLGIEGIVALHVPLGVSIVVSQVLFTVWVFRADAGRRRS